MTLEETIKIPAKDKKKITYLLLLAALAVMLLLTSTLFSGGDKEATDDTDTSQEVSAVNDKEQKLALILGDIAGVGRVSVAIEYDSSGKKEYAYNEEISENTSGQEGDLTRETTTRREMVMINGDSGGVLIEEIPPEITGVLVVAAGGGNAVVREKIQDAVISYLGISADKVAIYGMED